MTDPPRIGRWLLGRLVHPCDREHFLADVDDGFELRLSRHGQRFARRWYWRQVLLSAPSLVAHRIRVLANDRTHANRLGDPMWSELAQDLRYAVRGLRHHPTFT